MTGAPLPPGVLVETEGGRPESPLLVTGLAAAAIGNRSGGLSLTWECRGAPTEWGGVYGQGVRLTGPWKLRLIIGGRVVELPTPGARVTARRGRLEIHHQTDELSILEEIVASPDRPAVGRSLRLKSRIGSSVAVTVESEFQPYLSPVLVEGLKPYDYRAQTRGTTTEVSSHGFALALDSEPLPCHLTLNDASWIGGSQDSELRSVMSDYDLRVSPATPSTVHWVLSGGQEHLLRSEPDLGRQVLAGRDGWSDRSDRAWSDWMAATPQLRFPDAPQLEAAVELAKGGLRALYTAPDAELTGLVAGYPWYSAIWCRDLAWMLPALLWLGDYDWVARSLRSIFRWQAPSRLPILLAEAGELPMQISSGPIFLYGTSDTTLYYPSILRQYSDHSGGVDLARELWPALERVRGWMNAKVEPATGLFRHGDELEEIRRLSESVGKVHYGFDAVDTTIWDSADRRDHAIDLQVLYIQALDALANLAGRLGNSEPAVSLRSTADRIRTRIGPWYAWKEEGYLFDSLRRDHSPVRKLRPNALRAVSWGGLDPDLGRSIVGRAAKEDLTASWGVRTLSNRDPEFDPMAYHGGQVWTIATAWAADAALSVGERELGLRYLSTIAENLVSEEGLASECYRGDAPQPFDSCFLLGFSVAPFLTVIFERLWGLAAEPGGAGLVADPNFPAHWGSASLVGLRLGAGYVDLEWRPDALQVSWRGDRPLRVTSGGSTASIAPDNSATFPLTAAATKT